MIVYEGLFFDAETSKKICNLEPQKLDKRNDFIHCTFKYHPTKEECFDNLIGFTFDIFIIGYGNDGNNSGFEVRLPDELNKYYINYYEENPTKLKPPHITVSLSEGANPTNTKNLKFIPLEEPIKITGKFGYWIKKDNKEYLSFDTFYSNNNLSN